MSNSESRTDQPDLPRTPDLSLVIPCYNEENVLEITIPPLAEAFRQAGVHLQLVLVDNGSRDRTSEVIDRLVAKGLPITKGIVIENQGQGLGFLTGFQLSRGRNIGYVNADGQVAPDDVVAIYRALVSCTIPALAKARRRFRQDSWLRKINSIFYNAIMLVLFPGIATLDVNGNPKMMPAEILRLMELSSRDWFMEAEIILKAYHLGLKVIEINVPGYLRQAGKSHVRLATVMEFIRNIISYRLGGPWRSWRSRIKKQQFSSSNSHILNS